MIHANSNKRSRNNDTSTEPSKRHQLDMSSSSNTLATDNDGDEKNNDTTTTANTDTLASPQTATLTPASAAVTALWQSITLTTLDMKALYQYIKSKGDLGVTNPDGYGLVYLAAQNNSMEALRLLLLTSDLDVNTVHGPHQELALHAAASVGSFDALELLLDHGSVVDRQDSLGHTPLSNTLFAKASSCSDLLIQAGAALDTVDTQGNSLLHLAVSNQCSATMLTKLITSGVGVDQVNGRGLSPLAIAIGLGYNDAVRALLDGGADVNGKTRHATVLHHAVMWNRMETLEALVERGAAINTTNAMEETPLLVAVQQRKIDMVRYLCNKGADPAFGSNTNNTNVPLLYAANHGYTELCALLITQDTSTYFIQMAAEMSDRASFTATATYLRNKVQQRQTSATTTTAAAGTGTGTGSASSNTGASSEDTGGLLVPSSSSQSSLSTPLMSTTTANTDTALPSATTTKDGSVGTTTDDMIGSPNRLFDTDFSNLINTFSDDEDLGSSSNNNNNHNNDTSTTQVPLPPSLSTKKVV